MLPQYQAFIFEDFDFDQEAKKLSLHYSFDGVEKFCEEILFDFEFAENLDQATLDRAFFGLWVMAGISYFKAMVPPRIIFRNSEKYGLTAEQKAFFHNIYKQGLGEFFWENGMDPEGKINFFSETQSPLPPLSQGAIPLDGNIVMIGGGKDSLATTEILRSSEEKFATLTVNSDEKFEAQIEKINPEQHFKIQRKICPHLIALNKQGALNGHIPISSILAFLGVCTAILTGRKNIILSNESSANEPTVPGTTINHQYSKTLEFERDFQQYLHSNIPLDLEYFSLLRPFTELQIAEIFSATAFEKYAQNFSSCNQNFKIQNSKFKIESFSWCGACPKCAFVFAIFAPFVTRAKLESLFGGNLFADPDLAETFWELLGKRDQKPFECVGEILEVRKAFFLAREDFSEVEPFLEAFSEAEIKDIEAFDFEVFHENAIPERFKKILKKFSAS